MRKLSPGLLDMARLLLAEERAHSLNPADAAESTCARLRACLETLVGEEGFRVLLARAMVLAKRDAPWLAPVTVSVNCVLEGLPEASTDEDANEATESFATLLAHFLGLLVTFIGEPLTLRLVRDMWPEAPLDYTLPPLHVEAE